MPVMDSRNPQHPPYARDRPLHQNQILQQPPPPPSSYSYAPPTSQAPVHVPYTDPYNHRDPFMPGASQHQRSGSYGVHGGNNAGPGGQSERPQQVEGGWNNGAQSHHHSQSRHHTSGPPPPPSSTHHQSNTPGYGPETTRRRSISGSGGSPQSYYPNSRDSLPPPPGSRNMLPPSPQKASAPQYPNQQRNNESFSNNRELPSLGGSHRPGSALSISSLIGMDSSTPRSQPQNSPPTVSTAASPRSRAMQPPSPRRAPSTGVRNDFGMYGGRPRTPPERYRQPPSTRPSETHNYGATSPGRPNSGNNGPPAQFRPGYSPSSHAYKPMPSSDHRYYNNTSTSRENEQAQQGGIPPRPNSQPANGSTTQAEDERKSYYEPTGFRRHPPFGYPPDGRRVDNSQARPGTSEHPDEPTRTAAERERPVTVQPVAPGYSPPTESANHPYQGVPSPRSMFFRPTVDDSRKEPTREDLNNPPRSHFGPQLHTSQPPRPSQMSAEDRSRMLRGPEYPHARPMDPYNNMPPTSDPNAHDRRRIEQPGHSGSSSAPPYQARGPPLDPQHQRVHHLGPDAIRRTGRASPLPQAVQGASSQPVGPSGNTSIKSEFGRMFSGLGGGLGTPSRNGTTTPSRQSPLPQNRTESIPPGSLGDVHEMNMARFSSQLGRKPSNKRVKDEDAMMVESENGDGRQTPTASRGGKRSKHHHPEHHHHHRAPGHHHHHVHHKTPNEVDEGPVGGTNQPGASHFNTIRLGGGPGQPVTETHHHHHHIAHPSHHHHPPRPNPPPPREKTPETIVMTQSVLDGAAKHERQHLGWQLYKPTTHQPPSKVGLDDKFGFRSVPNSLDARIAGRENCTYDIRVDRYYLTAHQREVIVRSAYLWGTDIYREESDPLAAAIHSGWILGSWGDVDKPEIMDRRLANPREPSEGEETVSAVPSAPFEPPADMDLKITLLILPPLTEYPSVSQYGMTSIKAGGDYAGMSFKIHRIQWVEQGSGSRGQERSSEARNQRLQAAQAMIEMLTSGQSNGMAMNPGMAVRA